MMAALTLPEKGIYEKVKQYPTTQRIQRMINNSKDTEKKML